MRGIRCVAGSGGQWHPLRHVSQLLTRCCLIFMCSSTTPHGMMMTLTFERVKT